MGKKEKSVAMRYYNKLPNVLREICMDYSKKMR